MESDGTEHTACTVPFEMLAAHKSLVNTGLCCFIMLCAQYVGGGVPHLQTRGGEEGIRSRRCGEEQLGQWVISAVGRCTSQAGKGSREQAA